MSLQCQLCKILHIMALKILERLQRSLEETISSDNCHWKHLVADYTILPTHKQAVRTNAAAS